MKKLTLLSLLLLITYIIYAQETEKKWKRSFQSGLNFNQASFSDNWKGGGTNSVALGTYLNAKACYDSKKRISWDNDLQLNYGLVQNAGESMKKSMDKIFFDSKLGYKFAPKWNFFASTNFLSQFDAGFKYNKDSVGIEHETLISKFMSPGYFTHSVGVEYKPVDYFWVRFGTGTLRQTLVAYSTLYRTVPDNYGVDVGKHLKNVVALQLIANFDRDIMKNINFKTRAMALAPYDDFGRIVSRIDAILTARVNKYINVNISGTALNDLDQDADVQFNQFFGLGIMYNFSEFTK